MPKSKSATNHTPASAAKGVEDALKILEGRWKLLILFQLFDGKLLRFSDLERAIPAVSQKMLIQQLRQMEADGIVRRIVHHQVPPKVEYRLTALGETLLPVLEAMYAWGAQTREAASSTKFANSNANAAGSKSQGPVPVQSTAATCP